MLKADEILFRASGFGHLMANPQGKTNLEKYLNTKQEIAKLQEEYAAGNPLTKTMINKLERIKKINEWFYL